MSESLKAFESKMQERYAMLFRKDEAESRFRASHRAASDFMFESLEKISKIAHAEGYTLMVEKKAKGSWDSGTLVPFGKTKRDDIEPVAVAAGVDPPSLNFYLMNGNRAVECWLGFDIKSQRAYISATYEYLNEHGVPKPLFRGFEELYKMKELDAFIAKRDAFIGRRLNLDNLERHLAEVLEEYNKISDDFLTAQISK